MNAPAHLALKLRLERLLSDELAAYVRAYLDAWAEARTRGTTLIHAVWLTRLQELLARHYARTIRTIEDGRHVFISDERLEDIAPELAGKLYAKAQYQADAILGRIERELSEAEALAQTLKTEALDLIIKATQKPKWSVVVISSLRRSWARLKTRLPSWSNLNTQDVAEEAGLANQTAAASGDGFVDLVPDGQAEPLMMQWVTMLDEKVRPAHAAAHGQIVPVTGTYDIGGFRMRFPGDTQYGAPLSLIVNCRCISTCGVMRGGLFVPIPGLATTRGTTKPSRPPGSNPNTFRRIKPTPSFTFGYGKGPWRGNAILGTGERATYTVRDGGVTVRVGGQAVASAPITRDTFGKWTLGPVSVAPSHAGADIERLLRASVEASNRLGAR